MISLKMDIFFAAVLLSSFYCLVVSDYQGNVLVTMKSSLNASGTQLTDWNPDQVNPCTWSKIRCDGDNNVISISLSNMGFTGTLSPKIGDLKRLSTLVLQGNNITGKIPEEFGNLTSLTMLNLENNQLSGVIPPSIGNLKKLQFLIFSYNNLTGTIPESLSGLPNIIDL